LKVKTFIAQVEPPVYSGHLLFC